MVMMLTAATKATIVTIGKVLVACAPVVTAINSYKESKKK